MGRLNGKVCLVTGGGSGIGRATCELFLSEGARVAVMDKNVAAAEETCRSSREHGAEAISIHADIGRTEDVDRMIDETIERFGRLDVLVNNSGYGIAGSVTETSDEDWEALMNVNVTGVFRACRKAIPIMAAAGGGVIVNVASVVASVGILNRAAYCASKGAVAALTRAMALDHVGQNIRVNAIAPGTIHSPYFDEILANSDNADEILAGLQNRQAMKRLGKPLEIARGILYLASDESSFCTGTILTVDGGMTAQ
jgi:meso-butanediol dehydrogenase / (S,S)-butanediol dehydrogenase / diacetyl reductase